jgi:hypothetical protein
LAPEYLHDFKDVFSKTSFDELPAWKPWDHAIELIPDAQNKSCKVYPLSILEQEQLDKFLEENLTSGRICPSKSLMAAPFFFVKKNDGLLHLVQDYQALNAMTVKNKCPLPLLTSSISSMVQITSPSNLPNANGRNCKASCSSGITSMFLRMQTSIAGLLSNIMIPTLLDMQVGGKHWYPQLLVAANVLLHWRVLQNLRPLPPDKSAEATANG